MVDDVVAAHAIISIRSILLRSPNRRSPLPPFNWSRRFSPSLGSYVAFVRQRSPNIFILDDSPETGLVYVRMSQDFLTQGYLRYQRIVNESPVLKTIDANIHEDPQYVALCGIESSSQRAEIIGGANLLAKSVDAIERLARDNPSGFLRDKCMRALGDAGIPPVPFEWFHSLVVVPGSTVYKRAHPLCVPVSALEETLGIVEGALSNCDSNSIDIEALAQIIGTNLEQTTQVLKGCPFALFEPNMIYPCSEFERLVIGYLSPESKEEQRMIQELSSMSPFQHLIRSVQSTLENSPDNRIPTKHVIAWCSALDIKPRLVWKCLQDRVVWCAPHSELQVVFRSNRGKGVFPIIEGSEPLPTDIVKQIKLEVQKLGSQCTVDKLVAALRWGKSSENRRKYGMLASVLRRIEDLFYEPEYIFDRSSIADYIVIPDQSETIDTKEIFQKADTDYRNLMHLNATLIYYLTQGGYPCYPAKDVEQALSTVSLSTDLLPRLTHVFFPGNIVFLRKTVDELIVSPASVDDAVLFALKASSRKALDMEALFRVIMESGRYDQAAIETARKVIVTECRDIKLGGDSVLAKACFYNNEILDTVAKEYLEVSLHEARKPIVSEKQDLYDDPSDI